MGILEPKIKSAQALDIIAKEKTKACYKKPEFWANIIALGILVVTIIALVK